MLNTANISYINGSTFVLHLKLNNSHYANFSRPVVEEVCKTCMIISQQLFNWPVKLYDRNKTTINSMQWKDLITKMTPLYICIGEETIKLKYNYPEVIEVGLPQVILSNFECFPDKLIVINTVREDCKFRWYLKKKNGKWIQRSTNFQFIPSKLDVNSFVKLAILPKSQDKSGKWTEYESEYAIGHFDCTIYPFFETHQQCYKLQNNKFRVMSYNILSPKFCYDNQGKSRFPLCPDAFLSFDYRRNVLIHEILGYNSDIICLQEMMEHFNTVYLNPVLTREGYGGVFNETEQDGLAIFFNLNRFKLEQSNVISFPDDFVENSDFSELMELLKNDELLFAQALSLPTSLQLVLLESLDNSSEMLLVANVHLTNDNDLATLRLIQTGFFIIYLNELCKKNTTSQRRVSILFSGVFNDDKFLTTSCLNFDWELRHEPLIELLQQKHQLSCFRGGNSNFYTKFTESENFYSDYIVYQNDNLILTWTIINDQKKCKSMKGKFPSFYFPSNHIPIAKDFEWKSVKDTKSLHQTQEKEHKRTALEILFDTN